MRFLKAGILVLVCAFAAHGQALFRLQNVQSGGGAGPAFVQAKGAFFNTGTTGVVTLGSAVTAGHALYVFNLGASLPTIPTASGETFTTDTTTAGCQNLTGDSIQCWYTTNATGGETTLNCNWTSSTFNDICIVVEFTRPLNMSTPKDAGGNSSTAGATSLATSTSATTTNANDFVIACYGSFGTGSNAVSISGYTINANATVTNPTGQAACGYLVASSTGTQSATGSWTSSMRAAGTVMAFKP